MKLLFWLCRNKASASGACPIYVRITIDGQRSEISTGIFIAPEQWNVAGQRLKGNSGQSRSDNTKLLEMRKKIYLYHSDLTEKVERVTSDLLKRYYLSRSPKANRTLLKLISKFISEQTALMGIDKAKDTIRTYNTRYRALLNYLIEKDKKDVYPMEINLRFANEFSSYLKADGTRGHNYVMKNIQFLKQMLKYAVQMEELQFNALESFEFNMTKPKKIIYLTSEELEKLTNHKFASTRLQQTADVFLFCCHTGLAFADVSRFNESHIALGIDNNQWIFIERQKTGIDTTLPLLPKAIDLLIKYEYNLPVTSNQKMNSYLKEIGLILSIDKKLTTHVARKTFGMTMLNEHEIPMETVSAMLGHSSIKITQAVYAKIKERRISKDMERVMKSA
jgi:integrase/recombinase XerD